jgi:hypothetical protein
MASPFADVVNATATFTLPTTGTTTDAFGNVIAATETVTATLFLKGRQEIPTGTPGTEGTLTTLSGYAVDPMALDTRIRQGTEGTVTWQGATHIFEVLGRNVIYGDDGFISTTLTAERGDDITILLFRQQ